MDTDLDGKVSLAEYRSAVSGETMRAFFEYIDAQGVADGELTALNRWLLRIPVDRRTEAFWEVEIVGGNGGRP